MLGTVAAKPMPKEYGVIYALSAGAVFDLEMHRPDLIRQPEFRGFSREFLKVPESRSAARFPQGVALAWTVRHRGEVPDNCGVNWTALYASGFQLHKLKVENGARVLMLVEANPYQEAEHSGLPLKVTPADPDNLRIEPGLALTPGEYALVYEPREQAPTVFCFGIDAVTP
jgi:hypothetical protein